MFAALVATGAFIKISIPVQPFPMHFTLQFFLFCCLRFCTGREIGKCQRPCVSRNWASGVPVFAAGGGPAYLVRPTFGFLLGFAGAAYTTGTLSERLHRHTFLNLLALAFCRYDGHVSVQDALLLFYQQLRNQYARNVGNRACKLFPAYGGR